MPAGAQSAAAVAHSWPVEARRGVRRGTIIAMNERMRASSAVLCPAFVLISSAALLGCPSPGPAEQATDCPTKLTSDFSDTRKVAIGDGSTGSFKPYEDGNTIALIQGNQGLFMITPALQVEARPGDSEEACLRVTLDAEVLPDEEIGLQANVTFVKQGGLLVSDGAIYHPLGDAREELEGRDLSLTAIVQGEGFEGKQNVMLVLK
jgi:hypothetical protein